MTTKKAQSSGEAMLLRLKKLHRKSGMSAYRLAKELDMVGTTVTNWIHHDSKPTGGNLKLLMASEVLKDLERRHGL